MDFKLVGRTVLICSLCILLVLGVILYTNRNKSTSDVGGDMAGQAPDGSMTSEQYVRSSGNNIALNGDTRAFLSDDTFFDSGDAIVGEELSDIVDTTLVNEQLIRLSMLATSVERDLRIQIIDPDGNRVTGQPFFVTIDELGQFKDLDQDGVIYVGDMEPGDYGLSIDPLDGYLVASSHISVHVKEELEYKNITDIDLLIRQEEESDAAYERYTDHAFSDDRDDTEKTTSYTDLLTARNGIDVSSEQGEIDWNKVSKDGISFALIRCGYRGFSSGDLIEDACFKANAEGAAGADIRVGVYFFSQATTEKEAVEEASMVIRLCRSVDVALPVFLDVESLGGVGRADNLSQEERTVICQAFCETMKNAGYRAGIYSGKSFLDSGVFLPRLSGYAVWVAEYRAESTFDMPCQFWQHTLNGYVDGITGKVNRCIGNLDGTNIEEHRAVEVKKEESQDNANGDLQEESQVSSDEEREETEDE